ICGDTCFSPYFLKRKDTVIHQAVSSLLYRHLVFLLLLRRAGSGKELDWSKKEFVFPPPHS
ncbi:hypothetical protein EI218_08780, partial [Streptococcus suis]